MDIKLQFTDIKIHYPLSIASQNRQTKKKHDHAPCGTRALSGKLDAIRKRSNNFSILFCFLRLVRWFLCLFASRWFLTVAWRRHRCLELFTDFAFFFCSRAFSPRNIIIILTTSSLTSCPSAQFNRWETRNSSLELWPTCAFFCRCAMPCTSDSTSHSRCACVRQGKDHSVDVAGRKSHDIRRHLHIRCILSCAVFLIKRRRRAISMLHAAQEKVSIPMEFLVCFFISRSHLANFCCRFFVLLAELIEHAKGKLKLMFLFLRKTPNLNLNSLRLQSNFFWSFRVLFVFSRVQLENPHRREWKATRLFDIYGSEYLITASHRLIRRCAVKITIFSTLEHETDRNTGACCMQIAGERPNVCN